MPLFRHQARWATTAAIVLLSSFCGAAWSTGSWVWLDAQGRKVFSDLPPPPDVPDHKIIGRPGKALVRIESPTADTPAAASAQPAPVATPSPRPDPAEAAKRAEAEQKAEAERKATERRNAEIRADNCKRAQGSMATLNAGGRLATVNESGQRVVMDESMRAAEKARLDQIIRDNCR